MTFMQLSNSLQNNPSIRSTSSTTKLPPTHNNTHPSSPNLPQPPQPVLQMTPSVLFAAASDPIKLLDGLDQLYPPETTIAHLNAGITFQLGPPPLDLQSYITWHTRRMSLACYSLRRYWFKLV